MKWWIEFWYRPRREWNPVRIDEDGCTWSEDGERGPSTTYRDLGEAVEQLGAVYPGWPYKPMVRITNGVISIPWNLVS
jgi:hypothetical protein